MQFDHLHSSQSRLAELAEMLSAGCDPEFDFMSEELEREFQELRFMLPGDQPRAAV